MNPISLTAGRYMFVENSTVDRTDFLGMQSKSNGAGEFGCPGCCVDAKYTRPRKCCIKSPLAIQFVANQIDANKVGVVFYMQVSFFDNKFEGGVLCCSACCRFAQQAKARVIYNGKMIEDDDFTKYSNWEKVPEEFNTPFGPWHSYSSNCNPDGNFTTFNGIDMPGADAAAAGHQFHKGDKISMQYSFRAYVKDVCNNDQLVGPRRLYGFNSNGNFQAIDIKHWGFDK